VNPRTVYSSDGSVFLRGLNLGRPRPFHLERMVEGLRVGAQLLLLGNLGPLAQPPVAATRFGEQLSELAEAWACTRLLLMHSLIPQKPAPMPLREQRPLRLHARAQAVGVERTTSVMPGNVTDTTDTSSRPTLWKEDGASPPL
jgi:hypothetical protein